MFYDFRNWLRLEFGSLKWGFVLGVKGRSQCMG